MLNKTIYALSTILGKSGVAIVRVSGEACLDIARAYHFENKVTHGKLFKHKLHSTKDKVLIDDCLIVYFKSPKSFTGEDVLEFHTHGSVAIIKRLLAELALFDNVRIASPGEFSRRAFMNGKIDLSQAEGLAALIESETEVQRQVATRQMLGEQGSLYANWRNELIDILAKLEALIDFPTDDIPEDILDTASRKIFTILASINHHLSQDNRSEVIQRGIRVAIVGNPNAGKSSLLNAIAKRDVAITSEIAGTTRDIIEIKVDISGFPFIFYDTAGIRDSDDLIEREGVKRSYRAIEDSDLCLLVVDASTMESLNSILDYIRKLNKRCLIIFNKIDIISNDQNEDYYNLGLDCISMSLLRDPTAVENLIDYLKIYATENYTPISEPLLTNQRHKAHLNEARNYLASFNLDYSIDISSQYVRMAANSLGHIVGRIDVEEVLDTIFFAFCIGK